MWLCTKIEINSLPKIYLQTAEPDGEDIKEGLESFFSKSVASPEPQRTPTASPVTSTPIQVACIHFHQWLHQRTLRTVQQCPIVFADNGSCFASGERFPVTIASLRGRGQEPLHHPQAGGLCEEEGGAGQEEGGGDCEEGENGEDIKSIRTLLSSPKHSRRRY